MHHERSGEGRGLKATSRSIIVASPEELGLDPDRLERASGLLEQAIVQGAFPGAVALVARRGRVAAHWALGEAQVEPKRRSMQPDTVFDLASLTKAVAGATAALLLLEDGVWSLDDAVARLIPEFAVHGKQEVTLRHLLTHTAGFAGWVPTYARARDPEAALHVICDLELGDAPGTVVRYSDVGMSLIGHLVRRVTGDGIDRLLQSRVWVPLGMRDTCFNPQGALRERAAATERGNRFEQAMVANLGETFEGWREHVLVGEVNDGNTHYPLGGVSSHAGLFSTAADLFIFCQMYLDGGICTGRRIFSPATIAEATTDQTIGLAQSWGLGWQLLRKGRQPREEWAPSPMATRIFPPERYAFPTPRPFGELLSRATYGHTGFTGTSAAIDPARDLIIILLTNRTHPDAYNFAINHVRPRFHNLVAAAVV
ncbi:MAG: serine hydrolase domain-containing protein [Armatimonadota bacterium]